MTVADHMKRLVVVALIASLTTTYADDSKLPTQDQIFTIASFPVVPQGHHASVDLIYTALPSIENWGRMNILAGQKTAILSKV